MSEFNVEVVKIDKFEKHPNADLLSVYQVFGGYPVIFKTDNFKAGDKAVYIPVDALVPLDNPLFEFLKDSSGTKKQSRIKARKLRGVFSMGLLVPSDPSWEVGQNVQAELGIEKWEAPVRFQMQSECVTDPHIIPVYTDVEGLRKYRDVLTESEEVVVTEKIHGCNARYVYSNNDFWVGSHRQFKKRVEENLWWRAAAEYNLEDTLKNYPDIAVYGEVYGQVQDLTYEVKGNRICFAAFDVYDVKKGQYFNFDDAFHFCNNANIPFVPVLYRGAWKDSLWDLAEGNSTIAPSHVREGMVVRPVKERWDNRVGRVVLKLVGKGYHLRKENK